MKELPGNLPKRKRLSLYPLKFQEVIADVLKVKPEPREPRPKAQPKSRKRASKAQ